MYTYDSNGQKIPLTPTQMNFGDSSSVSSDSSSQSSSKWQKILIWILIAVVIALAIYIAYRVISKKKENFSFGSKFGFRLV